MAAQDEGFDLDEAETFLTEDEIGMGSCDPTSLPASTLTDCTFPLSGSGWEFYSGPRGLVARIDDYYFAVSSPCIVEDAELICRDLKVPSFKSTFQVRLGVFDLQDRLPTITVDREFDSVVGIVQYVDRIKSVFVDGTLALDVYRAGSLDENAVVDILLRRPGGAEVAGRARALEPGEIDGRFQLAFPEPGRWEFVSCALDDEGGCFRTGIPTSVVALDPRIEEVVEGLNSSDDARINIVFVGTGFDDGEHLRSTAEGLLALDGEPVPLSFDSEVYGLGWGPFSIDPLRQNIGKFNFWYLPDLNTGSPLRINPQLGQPEVDVDALGLGDHVVVVNMTLWGATDGFRATGELPSFVPIYSETGAASDEDPGVPTNLGDIRFGSVFLPLADADSLGAASVLSHELGHSLFGLRDEYEEYSLEIPTIGRPNCARDQTDAEALWGDLVGEVDPMFDRWREASLEAGIPTEFFATREDVTVGYVEGGCYAFGGGAVRPTNDSLMNGNIPVFGSVNRRRVEQVLDLWPEPTVTTTTAPPTTQSPATELPATASTAPSPTTTEIAAPPSVPSPSDGSNAGLIIALVACAALGVGTLILVRRRTATPS